MSGLGPIEDEELLRILDGEGLVCCATHELGKKIISDPQWVVERLKKFRCRSTAYPFPEDVDLNDLSSVEGLIAKLESSASILSASGLVLSYHNHHHEFRKLEGRTIFERIFDGAPHLQGELDTYWVQYGGGNPVDWCERLAGRLPVIHLKDYAVNKDNQPTYTEIGAGNLDFKHIVAAAEKSGCNWFIVEQDTCPSDPVDSLAQSYRYLAEHICEG